MVPAVVRWGLSGFQELADCVHKLDSKEAASPSDLTRRREIKAVKYRKLKIIHLFRKPVQLNFTKTLVWLPRIVEQCDTEKLAQQVLETSAHEMIESSRGSSIPASSRLPHRQTRQINTHTHTEPEQK